MTDNTREDFERWAKQYWFTDTVREKVWQAYQQGIADARKPSTETAAEWIARHAKEYECQCLTFGDEADHIKFFSKENGMAGVNLVNEVKQTVTINLETADDCEMLCNILRVVPVERTVGM